MTWARSHLPEQTAELSREYTTIGNETDSFVVPVGLAFDKSTMQENGIVLRIADRRHPTLAGTYLAACTFYAALFAESPVGKQLYGWSGCGIRSNTAENCMGYRSIILRG